jgi:hypothetical protein
LERLTGATYWTTWIIVGAVAPILVAIFVVPPIKGRAHPRAVAVRAAGVSRQQRLWLRHSLPCGFFGAPRA